MFIVLHAQAGDALAIRLAGRQHTLTDNIAWLTLTRPDSPHLPASVQLFEQTFKALRNGGTTVASGYEDPTQAKLSRLQLVQAGFAAAGLMLLGWGYWTIQRWVLSPLSMLQDAARRICRGELRDPVQPLEAGKLGESGRAVEMMAFEFSQEIVAQLELGHVLQSVVDRARVLMHARSCAVCLLDDAQAALEMAAHSGDCVWVAGQRQPADCDPAKRVVGNGQTVVTLTARATCGFVQAHIHGVCAMMPLCTSGMPLCTSGMPLHTSGVPLCTSGTPLCTDRTTLGALCVVRGEDKPFNPDETRALTLLAGSAAIAIANARLAKAQRRQAEQAAASAERARLAAELHDHLAQTMSLLHLKTDQVQEMLKSGHVAQAQSELEQIKSAIGVACCDVRAALVGLRESRPVADDLTRKLEARLEEFRQSTGITAEWIKAAHAAPALAPAMQTQAMHIVHEALTNIQRHARARRVWIGVEQMDGHASFTIQDDGCGFDPCTVNGEHHLGLAIMRERAERSGGRLTIDSAPNAGTKVIAWLPLDLSAQSAQERAT